VKYRDPELQYSDDDQPKAVYPAMEEIKVEVRRCRCGADISAYLNPDNDMCSVCESQFRRAIQRNRIIWR
jgi:hypothetical protein